MSTRIARRIGGAFALLLLAGAPGSIAAQSADLIPPGTRVRLLALGGYRADGPLLSLSQDSIVLRSDDAGRLGLPVGALRRLEARLPTGSTWRATRRGILAGATVGVVATGAAAVIKGGALDVPIAIPILFGSTAAGALGGALFWRGYAWRTVPLSSIGR